MATKRGSAVAHPKPPFTGQQQERPGSTDNMPPRPDHGEHSYRGNSILNGRVALITGADSGIGRAVAIAFAREGADVMVSYLCEDRQARETAHWVERAERRPLTIARDVADPAHCRGMVDRAPQAFGRLDVLVWTPLIPSTMPPEKVAHFGENTPLKRPGQPAELPAYVLLASDEGSTCRAR
jgi:hypothetical protein